ncbi:MAG: hypothetical protein NHB15_06565 [Methanosarcina barkeri]|nr:hypothetical protein [Methanosarcina sp. ERenArc_MAG2]MCO5381787.1 hypothetical protein [Methanosarcina sp. ERenArc_MAG2]
MDKIIKHNHEILEPYINFLFRKGSEKREDIQLPAGIEDQEKSSFRHGFILKNAILWHELKNRLDPPESASFPMDWTA